jgi:hypothetical protein
MARIPSYYLILTKDLNWIHPSVARQIFQPPSKKKVNFEIRQRRVLPQLGPGFDPRLGRRHRRSPQ